MDGLLQTIDRQQPERNRLVVIQRQLHQRTADGSIDVLVVRCLPFDDCSYGNHAGNFWQMSYGLNWKPNNNWIIRPELRYDWYSPDKANGALPFGSNFDKYGQLYGGCDAIWQF
jgi:hypothetical protein